MACFIVPAAEAVITTIVAKAIEKKESQTDTVKAKDNTNIQEGRKEPFSRKLKRLNALLWGGSTLLAFEHLWHGEIQPIFPFLTAMGNESDIVEMLREMSTVGVAMAIFITSVWGIVTFILYRIESKEGHTVSEGEQ